MIDHHMARLITEHQLRAAEAYRHAREWPFKPLETAGYSWNDIQIYRCKSQRRAAAEAKAARVLMGVDA